MTLLCGQSSNLLVQLELTVVHSNITYQRDQYDLLGYREVVTNELR